MAFPNFFKSDKCQQHATVKPVTEADLVACGLMRPVLQAYLEPEKHPLAKVGGRVGELLELFSLGRRITYADAQGASFSLYGLSYMTAGDKRLREARDLLREYGITVSSERDDGHKVWWLEYSERVKLNKMMNN